MADPRSMAVLKKSQSKNKVGIALQSFFIFLIPFFIQHPDAATTRFRRIVALRSKMSRAICEGSLNNQ
jgi:hypothetical protein